MVRLFHFSDDPDITVFRPRTLRIPSARPAGMEWLNSPLVWSIDSAHQKLYLFPRECPRIVMWSTSATTHADVDRWLQGDKHRSIAYIEKSWKNTFQRAHLYRYEFDASQFIDLDDAGMWVSKEICQPLACKEICNLALRLKENKTDIKFLDSLTSLKSAWQYSIHASGIRLRNAKDWHT